MSNLWPLCGRPGNYGEWLSGVSKNTARECATKYSLTWTIMDLTSGVIGAMDRQGFFEYVFGFMGLVSIIPPMKMGLFSNPFLFHLQNMYVNQWSPVIDADGDGKAYYDHDDFVYFKTSVSEKVCNNLLTKDKQEHVDGWDFAGFHQWPPVERESQTTTGMQFAGGYPAMVLIAHSTVAMNIPGAKARSPFAHEEGSLLNVHLMAWNLCYHFTGYVEVNIRKDNGIEHPMWLIADPNSYIHWIQLWAVNQLFVKLGEFYADYYKKILSKRRPYIYE